MGYTGSIGFTGSQGAGFTGSAGYVGSQGELGYTGSQGAGFTGSTGFTGSEGFTGSIGFTGSRGQIGRYGGVSFDYTFDYSSGTTNPGSGRLNFNNLSLPDATALITNVQEKNGVDIGTFLRTVDDPGS